MYYQYVEEDRCNVLVRLALVDTMTFIYLPIQVIPHHLMHSCRLVCLSATMYLK